MMSWSVNKLHSHTGLLQSRELELVSFHKAHYESSQLIAVRLLEPGHLDEDYS